MTHEEELEKALREALALLALCSEPGELGFPVVPVTQIREFSERAEALLPPERQPEVERDDGPSGKVEP